MKKRLCLLSAILLAGCASMGETGDQSGQESAPQATSTDDQPGTTGSNRTSKADASKTDASKASECGQASYYADSLAGNNTASGEPYDPKKMTAAHKTLPFDTMLRVVRKDTGDEVEVRVNDRGPFTPGRIIDLSRAAAAKIDLVTAGVAEVCIYVK